jgi:hypothetical protein
MEYARAATTAMSEKKSALAHANGCFERIVGKPEVTCDKDSRLVSEKSAYRVAAVGSRATRQLGVTPERPASFWSNRRRAELVHNSRRLSKS